MTDTSVEIRKLQNTRSEESKDAERILLTGRGQFDKDIYGDSDERESYVSSLPLDNEDEESAEINTSHPSSRTRINGSRALIDESLGPSDESTENNFYRENFGSGIVNTRISDRETEVFGCYIFKFIVPFLYLYSF